jgi:hypothetical protein
MHRSARGRLCPRCGDAVSAAPAGPWPVDGGGVSGIACRSVGPVRSAREGAADVHCGIGLLGGQRPSMGVMSSTLDTVGRSSVPPWIEAGGRACLRYK